MYVLIRDIINWNLYPPAKYKHKHVKWITIQATAGMITLW